MKTFLAATSMALAMSASELTANTPELPATNFLDYPAKQFWEGSGKTNRTANTRQRDIKKEKNRRRMAAQSRKANR